MRAPGIIRVLRLCAVSLCLTAAAPALLGTAFAQSADGRGVEAFTRAAKAYEAGDWNTAAGAVDDAMQAGLSKELSARAYHLRAHIDERSGALARALQDYSTALFMDTLPQSERKVALEGKQRVIAAMGLNSFTPGASHADASPPAAPQSSSGGSVWDMFGGVFGSSQPAPPPPPAPPPVQAAGPAPAPAPEASTSATRVVTRAKPRQATPAKLAAPPKAAQAQKPRAQPPVRIAAIQPVATAPASSTNGFLILFGSTGSEAASRTRARQIKAALADILVSREVDVLASADGSYQIAAGPYKAKSAALALCSAMKQRGVACQVTP